MEKKKLVFDTDEDLLNFFTKHPACLGDYEKVMKELKIEKKREKILGKGG